MSIDNRNSCSGGGSPSEADSSDMSEKSANLMEKGEIRLRKPKIKSDSTNRPRTMSGMSKKLSTISDDQPIRMTDYLEKRSKVLGWKKYWFVLDGHLLTYYKSKDDYDKIAPFSGSINLGIASTVRPIQIKGSKGFPLQIVTRSQVYYLRSLEKQVLDKWLLVLQERTSTPPQISNPFWTDPGDQLYRYSSTALSQWSLQEPSDDTPGSLSNSPKDFYLNPGLKKKCHSFASLPYGESNKKGGPHKEMTELRSSGPSGRSVRQATSMLVLESSPQAMELKRELERKLVMGQRNGTGNGTGRTTGNIAGNITGNGKPYSKPHSDLDSDENVHYDEIIDFEALNLHDNPDEIYETVDPWEKLKMDPSLSAEKNRHSHTLSSISEVPEAEKGVKDEKPVEPEPPGKMAKRKKGLAGILQRMFSNKKKEAARNTMVITGPVDLKSEKERERKFLSQNSPADSVTKNSTALKSDPVMDELKSKVGQLKRANSELTPVGNSNENKTNLARRSTIQVLADKPQVPTQKSLAPTPKAVAPTPNPVTSTPKVPPMTLLFQNSITEYQQKLAKFNRLSAHLNPSFVAHFKPSPVNVVLGQMGRSSSCKIKTDDPPSLPPKKKISGGVGSPGTNAYDIPCNNQPVIQLRSSGVVVPPTLRQLAKKNSAPDIMFSSSPSTSILPHILRGEAPPPRPPKQSPEFRVVSLGEFVNVSEKAAQMELSVQNSCSQESHRVVTEKSPEVTDFRGPVTQEHEGHYENVSTPDNIQPEVTNAGAGTNQIAMEAEIQEIPAKSEEVKSKVEAEVIEASENDVNAKSGGESAKSTENEVDAKSAVGSVKPMENKVKAEIQGESVKSAENAVEAEIQGESTKSSQNELETESEAELTKSMENETVAESQSVFEKSSDDSVEEGVIGVESVKCTENATETGTPSETKKFTENNVVAKIESESAEPTEPDVKIGIESDATITSAPTDTELHGNTEVLPDIQIPMRPNNFSGKPDTNDSKLPEISESGNSPAVVRQHPLELSPSLSNRSFCLDNLDALSDLSDDSPVLEFKEFVEPLFSTNPLESEPKEHPIYQNLKYATINTLFTEYETVEEECETYYDIPTEFTIPIPLATRLSANTPEEKSDKNNLVSFRHSGIDEREKYMEFNGSDNECNPAGLSRQDQNSAIHTLHYSAC